MQAFFKNISPLYRFIILFGVAAIVWFVVYQYYIRPHTILDITVVKATLVLSKKMLTLLGHKAFIEDRNLRIAGTSGLWVGDNCNAISLFALFSGFILCFPGNIKSKLWFIPTGIVLIFLLNCIRMVVLAITDVYSRKWTEFNHSYTFNIIIYGFIFFLWMYWVNRYSFVKTLKSEKPGV